MSYDQPASDPTAAHDPTELQPLQQIDPIDIDFSQVQPLPVQPDLSYNVEVPDSIQLETAPPTVSGPQLDLSTAGDSQAMMRYRVDLPDDYTLKGLPEYDPYPGVEITDPNILPAPTTEFGNKGLAPSRRQHVNENWSGDYEAWGRELQPQGSQLPPLPTYRNVTPPILPRRGRGFNPNRASRWRVPRRVPQFHYEYREDVACHCCGEHKVFLGKCYHCSIDVLCPSCQDTTDGEGRCQNPGCHYYAHKPDDPKCHDCGVFVSEGETWCSECQTRYPDSC